jgi:hypothetical protein
MCVSPLKLKVQVWCVCCQITSELLINRLRNRSRVKHLSMACGFSVARLEGRSLEHGLAGWGGHRIYMKQECLPQTPAHVPRTLRHRTLCSETLCDGLQEYLPQTPAHFPRTLGHRTLRSETLCDGLQECFPQTPAHSPRTLGHRTLCSETLCDGLPMGLRKHRSPHRPGPRTPVQRHTQARAPFWPAWRARSPCLGLHKHGRVASTNSLKQIHGAGAAQERTQWM